MPARSRLVRTAAVVAVIFGLLTILSGGRALFGGADMGAVVPFVLWFNFLAGIAYIVAGLGLWYQSSWGTGLAMAIALTTAAVFVAFLLHVSKGAAFEARTMGAMGLRLAVWATIAVVAWTRSKARQT